MSIPQHQTIRVRFAPSPTGHLHIGGLRAAIFNWLFARHYKGTFLLRIEDTDKERSQQQYTDAIIDTFAWMGITSDEPLVIQTERIEQHTEVLHDLLKKKKAYRCYCSQEEVLERHIQKGGDPLFVKYDGYCKPLPETDNKNGVIRFMIPECTDITFVDLIRGPITVNTAELDDFIIARADETPMYNFVVVVDDAFMNITHVIRGEDHISNTPKQILLYKACGYPLPFFAHAPNILGPSGKKLSKREAAASVLEYRQMGYVPEALCNYLVRLGWSHGDQEIFSQQQLIDCFTLEAVGKKGSIFDKEKLDWLNGHYIRTYAAPDLYQRIITDVQPTLKSELKNWTEAQIVQSVELYKDRVKTLQELVECITNLYTIRTIIKESDKQQWLSGKNASLYIKRVIETLPSAHEFNPDTLKQCLNLVAKEYGVKLVSIAQPVRIALLATSDGPGVLGLLAFLGREESIDRLRALDEWMAHNQ